MAIVENSPFGDSFWALGIILPKNKTIAVSRAGTDAITANPGFFCIYCKVSSASRLSVDRSVIDLVTRGVGEGS